MAASRRLPALGVRERGARSRAAAERPLARRRARARVPAGALRRLDARRRVRLARAQPGARAEARSGERLGPAVHGAARRDRARARPRPEGVLHAAPPSTSCRTRSCTARSSELFPEAVLEDASLDGECGEVLRGAGGPAQLRRADPLRRRTCARCRSSPGGMNIKPSRFGTTARLLECIEYCEREGHPDVRRRPVRARCRPAAHPGAGVALLSGRPERRRAERVQRRRAARWAAQVATPATGGRRVLKARVPGTVPGTCPAQPAPEKRGSRDCPWNVSLRAAARIGIWSCGRGRASFVSCHAGCAVNCLTECFT